jgi:hypothetical protein
MQASPLSQREKPMRKHHEDQATSTEKLEDRTQRDQEERSKQALSNQGSQDRKPVQPDEDRERRDREPQPQ